MTLEEMKKKTLALIEELDPDSKWLTDDPDIAAKLNAVTNQILFELARYKKLPRYVELAVEQGQTLTFADLEAECGSEVYQIALVTGVDHRLRAGSTRIQVLETGTMGIDCYVYPERITDRTPDKAYEFELSPDVLEIMPYGIAADLLKSDASAEFGTVYANRYESMRAMLDPRYGMNTIRVEGGVVIP